MKLIKPLLLLSGLLIISCSSDDSTPEPQDNDVSTADFLPLATGNYWVYDTQSSMQAGRDSLYIPNEIVISNNSYSRFLTKDLPLGFFCNSIYNDGIRKSGDKLLLTGTAEFGLSEEFALTIPITDLVILKENAAANQTIGSVSGSMMQQIQGYDVQFEYTLTTRAKENLASYTLQQDTYHSVKKVETVLNLKITALFALEGFGTIPVAIMPAQNVMVSTQYYAEDIGVVHVVSDINYQLADLSAVSIVLPFPQSGTEHQEEVLDVYSVE